MTVVLTVWLTLTLLSVVDFFFDVGFSLIFVVIVLCWFVCWCVVLVLTFCCALLHLLENAIQVLVLVQGVVLVGVGVVGAQWS